MASANLVFPHQLFEKGPLVENTFPVYLIEEYLFFNQYKFHRQKIAFHRATMKFYADYLDSKGVKVHYVDAQSPLSDIRKLIPELAKKQIKSLHIIDPCDDWLQQRIVSASTKAGIDIEEYETQLFLNNRKELTEYFTSDKKKFFQTDFYMRERKKRRILIGHASEPLGGKWSFDAENRKRYPATKQPPQIIYPGANSFYQEAKKYVETHYENNPGKLTKNPLQPIDFAGSKKWFRDFLTYRFDEFGPYEDAIVKKENILHHSKLTPMLNVGLITPKDIIDETIKYSDEEKIPLNSTEGFIRQVMGWREFMRGVYVAKGIRERTTNYWGFTRKLPASFYDGSTGVDPVDGTIKKVLQTGYCHHIERLMVLGNFMLLCEIRPDDVYKWFMELFIDAYDWVMVPNVYGMSQFADGGLMSTKPYISGSNYIVKMSDYKKGPWQEVWDSLFWRFMNVHRSFFERSPRLGMLIKSFDKLPKDKQKQLMDTADKFLEQLN